MDHPFIATLTRSGPVGQGILGGLVVLSLYTWAVIFSKTVALGRAAKSCRQFLGMFLKSGDEWIASGRGAPMDGPLAKVFEGGMREYGAQRQMSGGGSLDAEAVQRIEAALESEIVDQVSGLEKGHVILAIAASASPFIGLFGTVWGIMNAFRGMSLEGSAGIAAVAPGVAEALVTTVAGLAVAIPAVVAYNLLNRRAQLITGTLDRFATEFLRTASLASRRGASPSGVPGPASPSPVFARRDG